MRPKSPLECKVEGCAGPRQRAKVGLCEKHYYRMRRTGSTDLAPRNARSTVRHGYVIVKAEGHPLAGANGWAYEHRVVAYTRHGFAPLACYWCGKPTTWKDCHVDHLDGMKVNNAPENLAVTCAGCNRARGACWPFLKSLSPAKRQELFALIGGDVQGNPIDPNHHWNQRSVPW